MSKKYKYWFFYIDDEEAMEKVIRVLEELNDSEHTKNDDIVG